MRGFVHTASVSATNVKLIRNGQEATTEAQEGSPAEQRAPVAAFTAGFNLLRQYLESAKGLRAAEIPQRLLPDALRDVVAGIERALGIKVHVIRNLTSTRTLHLRQPQWRQAAVLSAEGQQGFAAPLPFRCARYAALGAPSW